MTGEPDDSWGGVPYFVGTREVSGLVPAFANVVVLVGVEARDELGEGGAEVRCFGVSIGVIEEGEESMAAIQQYN